MSEADGERIAKVIARAGICSRREAERLIAAGRVAVDGRVLESPAVNVGPEAKVTVDGRPLPEPEQPRLWRYHKPPGLITTARDLPLLFVQPNVAWGSEIAPTIDEIAESGREHGLVRSFLERESLESAPINSYAIRMARNRTVLGAGKIDPVSFLIYTVELVHGPFTRRYGASYFVVFAVVVDVPPSGTFAEPKKRVVPEPAGVVRDPDPRFGTLAEKGSRLTRSGIGHDEVQPCLFPVLNLVDDPLTAGCPRDATDQMVHRFVGRCIHPSDRPAVDVHDAQPDFRVWIPRLGITHHYRLLARSMVHHRTRLDLGFVEPQECDVCGVGTPPIRPKVASSIQFFLIYPVETADENVIAPFHSERAFGPSCQVHDVDVVVLDVADQVPIRTEVRSRFHVDVLSHEVGGFGAESVVEEIGPMWDQRRRPIGTDSFIRELGQFFEVVLGHVR